MPRWWLNPRRSSAFCRSFSWHLRQLAMLLGTEGEAWWSFVGFNGLTMRPLGSPCAKNLEGEVWINQLTLGFFTGFRREKCWCSRKNGQIFWIDEWMAWCLVIFRMTIFSDKFEKGKLMVQNEWSLKVQCSDTKHIINVVFLSYVRTSALSSRAPTGRATNKNNLKKIKKKILGEPDFFLLFFLFFFNCFLFFLFFFIFSYFFHFFLFFSFFLIFFYFFWFFFILSYFFYFFLFVFIFIYVF